MFRYELIYGKHSEHLEVGKMDGWRTECSVGNILVARLSLVKLQLEMLSYEQTKLEVVGNDPLVGRDAVTGLPVYCFFGKNGVVSILLSVGNALFTGEYVPDARGFLKKARPADTVWLLGNMNNT